MGQTGAKVSTDSTIGKSIPKVDAYSKATGSAIYVADIIRPHMLHGKVLRSPYAHAMIREIDISDVLTMPGVRAVITAKDIPGQNRIGMTGAKDQRVFAEEKVRFLGEAVAAVAAETIEEAEAAVEKIKVVYEELPIVSTVEEALLPDAPKIDEKGNICIYRKVVKGDWEKGLKDADIVIEGEYRTAPVEHAYIELEASLVEPEGEGILLWSTTKSVHLDQREVARVLGWPIERIRVVAPNIGGSFGGKSDLALNCITALLSVKANMPVAISYSREESMQVTTKRHGCIIRYRHGAKKDGTLTFVKLDLIADAGAYNDYTSTVLPRMVIFGAGPYRVPNVMLEVRGVLTNNPISGAMRGFGQPQVTFACERQMDRLARALNMDPFEIRIKNALGEGDTSATGQTLTGVTIKHLLEMAREHIKADQEKSCGQIRSFEREGWGIAASFYGNGRTGMPNPGVARTYLTREGCIEVAVGSPDIGQGSNTIYRQIAAAVMDIKPEHVNIITADTRYTPDSGTTSGTRNTAIVGKAVKLSAEKFYKTLLNKVAAFYSFKEEEAKIRFREGSLKIEVPGRKPIPLSQVVLDINEVCVEETYDPPVTFLDENGQGNPYAFYTYGVQCARVRVNLYTGKVAVDRVIAAYDVGTVINPILLNGQIEGGVVMGIGYALSEEIRLSRGKVTNNNFDTYILPTSMDIPMVEIIIMPSVDKEGPFGAKGIGEPAIVPTAGAIGNAVANAAGIEFFNLPLSLEEVTNVLSKKVEV